MDEFTEMNDDIEMFLFDNDILSMKQPNHTVKCTDPYTSYDERTTKYYVSLRHQKLDPILNIHVSNENAFKYVHIWDPYTGEIKHTDPNGPLYFDPDTLIHYFYTNRLQNLWNEPLDETAGYFAGYYDMCVGTGKLMNIIGRGLCPEKYLFRLPVIDCYLEKEHMNSVITMGAELSDDDINELYNTALKNIDNYETLFGLKRPNIIEIKKYYDIAISSEPDITHVLNKHNKENSTDLKITDLSNELLKQLRYYANCNAIDKLRTM